MTDPSDPYDAVPRLFGTAFSEHPAEAYTLLRADGPVAWGEIEEGVPALVVTGYNAARALLADPEFTRDPGAWQAPTGDAFPPGLALMRTGGLQHVEGEEHKRLRKALDDCLAGVDLHGVRRSVRRHARGLIDGFAHRGHADLMAEYADPVTGRVLAGLLGVSGADAGLDASADAGVAADDAAQRIGDLARSVVDAGPDAADAAKELGSVLREFVRAKRADPGADVTSWLLAHPAGLDDGEVELLLSSLLVLGAPPTAAWIGAALHALLTEPAYAGELVGGAATIRDAMDAALATRSPVANASVHYTRRSRVWQGVHVPAGMPILVSHAATGLDPARPGRERSRDRSHLAWSAGPHRCPAPALAATIAEAAIEAVVDVLWDLSTPTSSIAGRPGPFQQCPVHLGVLFAPDERGSAHERGAVGASPAVGGVRARDRAVETSSGVGKKEVTVEHAVSA